MKRAFSLPLPRSFPSSLILRWLAVAALALALALSLGRAATGASAAVELPASARVIPVTGGAALPPPRRLADRDVLSLLGDSLRGVSGKLTSRIVPMAEWAEMSRMLGDGRRREGGVLELFDTEHDEHFALLALRDFGVKTGAYVGGYRVGYWPGELRRVRASAYRNPTGFVEVTRATADTRLSEHFLLRDFLTHDQDDVWPKYLVLREALIDKLELVLDDLRRSGHRVDNVIVLSGFRTPAYNLALGDASGRARESRHQYGDAADIIIDADRDGRMDDLDMDGRSDVGDVRVVERSVERVERLHPELVGGLGLYQAMGPRGPFAHIDVRGEAARWTGSRSRASAGSVPGRAAPVAGCQATGASAVLCSRIRRHPRR
ncbi:MAG TPA: D-Ala-D-Ala carboxypeptidase family metallohydrolase [Gemmatimonadaceae bacterium]|nr:D-Ala-D-Ala carboxypeptidase family metallohydrolase [Gemmatimonadaceae bacterium]